MLRILQTVFIFVRRFWLLFVVLILIALIGGAFLMGRESVYRDYPELSDVERANAILDKVGKLIELPQGEFPQIAIIENAESVRQTQPLLVNAVDGDILIVYTNAKMALLYRSPANKLIAVGPVTNVESNPSTIQPLEENNSPTTPPSVVDSVTNEESNSSAPSPSESEEEIEDENVTTTDE